MVAKDQYSILVIDDEKEYRDRFSKILETEGYTVATTSSVADAQTLLSIEKFDLIILDILMPEKDGYQMLAWIKAQTNLQSIPIIMLPSANISESIIKCIEMDASDYLIKPINEVLLKTRVWNCLRHTKMISDDGQVVTSIRQPDETTILVVDDEDNNRDVISRRVRKLGYNVEVAANGRSAFTLIKNGNYDMVLLDIMMPIMDGYEFLEIIKADEELKHIPIIMISAITEVESVERCLSLGACDYLHKPFNMAVVKSRIRSCLPLI